MEGTSEPEQVHHRLGACQGIEMSSTIWKDNIQRRPGLVKKIECTLRCLCT
ncbi:hypothetical protein Syun_031131 [Stephania yunnanensis]|uniref:Uncharacterized protein n=1 Tax=Stephania yunnanensis TaxID=152371 RepID=A0AAP0DY81_9MAGN